MSDETDIEQKLAAMRRGYTHKLRSRLETLRTSTARARDGDDAALERAVSEAHKLHGTAGSYGFAAVSSVIGEVEVALKRIASEGAKSPAEWDGVLDRIERALTDPSLASSEDG
jgi:HPt (histidine-containing phosphotransfer) domain-containing protein